MGLISRVSSRTYRYSQHVRHARCRFCQEPLGQLCQVGNEQAQAMDHFWREEGRRQGRPRGPTPPILPNRRGATTIQDHRCRKILPRLQEVEAGYRAGLRAHSRCWPTPWQASRVPQAARERTLARYWSIQDHGVPMRHVNQKYVLPTSTKLDFTVSLPERVNDEYFNRIELNAHEGQDQGEIFQTKKQVYKASPERKEDQKAVDAAIVSTAKKIPYMVNYLSANFALRNGQNPATMKF